MDGSRETGSQGVRRHIIAGILPVKIIGVGIGIGIDLEHRAFFDPDPERRIDAFSYETVDTTSVSG